jgi:hypothetical protein
LLCALSILLCAFARNAPNLHNISRKGAKSICEARKELLKSGHYCLPQARAAQELRAITFIGS